MKKFLIPAAMAGLILASCTNDEFVGMGTDSSKQTDEISFAMNVPNLTRANTFTGVGAAQKLNNNFVVYGFKYFGAESTDAADVANADKQQKVFGRYNVNYEGNAGATKTNTSGWEYVGYTSLDSEQQTMKYWDYMAAGYVFSAVSGTGFTPTKIESGATVYDKGWNITIPAGGSISDLYASARSVQTKAAGADNVYKYPETVTLTFYSMATKVRFAIYETVPGYSIHIDKFYCKGSDSKFSNESNSTTNFGINGKFLGPNANAETTLKVTYYDAASGIENRPMVSYDETTVTPNNTYSKLFGTNISSTAAIGETSVEATYDQADGAYTFILPYQNADNKLELYVDYTLKAANGETIKVSQAKATVPAQYTQWKENFAYTYIFKISDNTNGTTGTPKDSDDPTKPWDPSEKHDPEGLYPISFDACVINAEDGIQESLTSIATPSITTYQKGVVVTANDTYTAGDVYYTSCAKDGSLNDLNASKVYEVYYTGAAALTEVLVADYASNDVTLVPVTAVEATSVPCSDGTDLTFDANKCYKFTAVAGKTYAINTNNGWKVVKVAGTYAAPVFKMTVSKGEITEANGQAEIGIKVGDAYVTGAKQSLQVLKGGSDVTADFVIEETDTSAYIFKLTASAIAAGANGSYTVKYADKEATFTVNLTYTFDPADQVAVIAGKSATFKLMVGTAAVANATIENSNTGITVKETATAGQYEVSADATKAGGEYNFTLAGQSYKVVVTSYSFSLASIALEWAEGATAPTMDVTLKYSTGSTPAQVTEAKAYESSDTTVFASGNTQADGTFTFKPLKGGKTTISFENAQCDATVNQYELKSSAATIDKSTGLAVLTFWKNNEKQNAVAKSANVWKGADLEHLTVVTSGFSLVSNGASLSFGNVTTADTYWIKYWNEDGTTCLGYEKVVVE